MAKRILTLLVDDLPREDLADDTAARVAFGLEGVTYSIDLHERRATERREMINRYAERGRRTGGAARSHRASEVDSRAVRAWAASNGVDLSPRGRIPASVLDQFLAVGH